jgi:hypothetical protein
MGNGEHDELGERDTLDKQEARSAPKMRSALSALLGDFALAAGRRFLRSPATLHRRGLRGSNPLAAAAV